MELTQANALAVGLMEKYDLTATGWKFKFDSARSRFGVCNYTIKMISLSQRLTELNPESDVRNTILHEIAHALIGRGHGHDKMWKKLHISIGGDGERLYKNHVIRPEKKWVGQCEKCGTEYRRQRISSWMRVACSRCCDKHNYGRFDVKYVVKFYLAAARPAPTVTFNQSTDTGRAFDGNKWVNVVNGEVQP